MKEKRLFLAIPIGSLYVKKCMQFIDQQCTEKIRWIAPEYWHITLVFLGKFPTGKISLLVLHLKDFYSRFSSFELVFDKYLYKPDFRNPKMIWAKFKPSETFDQYVKLTVEYLKELYETNQIYFSLNIRQQNIPHVTLARLKQEYQAFPKLTFEAENNPPLYVKDCQLFESVLLPKGAEYHLLHTFGFESTH